ncbi:methyltransferase domain-containing protein [Geobacter pelophilus]|uniref:Methyltransferase domain-containing protein n=1 Tax=Geoanaerobacter pelophilus TaxID=60036 RepID=A0AAW4LDG2_9BACT|nr:class I SAM-dependent methyltransferase [Geoanaerobacter pelophilus]MBT0666471.1 methyltransferase domain-containing protein [Geoanaerobacter pelophilus]
MNWNECFSEPGFAYGTEPNDFLVSVVARIPKGRLLSLAEGEGRNAVYLAALGYEVTAVDGSPVGLRKAEELAAERGVAIKTILADLGEFEIEPEQWDGIIAFYCHVPSSIRMTLHRAVVRGLKPGGMFALEAFSKEQIGNETGGPKSLDMLMSLDELRGECAGLDFIHAKELQRDVHEGRGHTGLASVVQILGVKP